MPPKGRYTEYHSQAYERKKEVEIESWPEVKGVELDICQVSPSLWSID